MILTGIGTGPADSGHLTLNEVRAIKEADVIFAPNSKGKNRALDTAQEFIKDQEIIYLDYPMGNVDEEVYKRNAKIIEDASEKYEKSVFLTIGDAMVYSTFYNTAVYIKKADIRIVSEPGIPSFLGAFNATMQPLCLKGENFLLSDGEFDERVLEFVDSIAILKTGKNKEEYINILEKHNFKYTYVKRLSEESEVILTDKEEILKDSDYISLIIARKIKGDK